MYSIGGTAVLGDATVTLSKSKTNGQDRLFGSIDYLSDHKKATARIAKINDLVVAETVYSQYFGTDDKYLQVGVGMVSGQAPNGQTVNDKYGRIQFSAPIHTLNPLLPRRVVVSSSWHNDTTNGSGPEFTDAPPLFDEASLFLMHEQTFDDISGHIHSLNLIFGLPIGW